MGNFPQERFEIQQHLLVRLIVRLCNCRVGLKSVLLLLYHCIRAPNCTSRRLVGTDQMPKQRGGWKGTKPPGGKNRSAAPKEEADSADEMLYDEVRAGEVATCESLKSYLRNGRCLTGRSFEAYALLHRDLSD